MSGSSYEALFLVVIIGAWLSSCVAYDFYVGGKHGWFPDPYDPFNNWAGRNRFQVKDKIGTVLSSIEISYYFSFNKQMSHLSCSPLELRKILKITEQKRLRIIRLVGKIIYAESEIVLARTKLIFLLIFLIPFW
jgi:Plastocyanin-like domain